MSGEYFSVKTNFLLQNRHFTKKWILLIPWSETKYYTLNALFVCVIEQPQYAHDVVLTSVRRRFNVMNVVWTSKRHRVLTGTLRFDCLHSFMVSIHCCFLGTKVDWWLVNNNVIFFCFRFIFACCFVLYSYARSFENPEISGFCVSRVRAVQWRKSKSSVVL